MSLLLTIFDVGRGQCVAISTPNKYLVMIDCGCSAEYSPASLLSELTWRKSNDCPLALLVISHPHEDHIADIETVSQKLTPNFLKRRTDINMDRASPQHAMSSALQHYTHSYMPPQFTETPTVIPDWGDKCTIHFFYLSNEAAERVSSTDTSYINNTSIVTIIKYKGYTFAINGDIETDGMRELLKEDPNLITSIANHLSMPDIVDGGVDFLVAPHHGHPSAFSKEWFDFTGPTRRFNIVSERRLAHREDPSRAKVDQQYSEAAYSLANNPEGRRMVSTRKDGTILIKINDNGTWSWSARNS